MLCLDIQYCITHLWGLGLLTLLLEAVSATSVFRATGLGVRARWVLLKFFVILKMKAVPGENDEKKQNEDRKEKYEKY